MQTKVIQPYNKPKQKKNKKVAIIVLAVLLAVSIIGTTVAWFTSQNDLTGGGNNPLAEVNLYSNGAFLNGESGSSTDIVTVMRPVYNKTIERDTTIISGSVQFDCGDSNIDLLVVASINPVFLESGTTDVVKGTDDWLTINVSSAWTKGTDGRYYYNSKISSSNAGTKITVFDTITINDTNAEGKDLQIVVYIDIIQANQTGVNALDATAGYELPNSFKSLV